VNLKFLAVDAFEHRGRLSKVRERGSSHKQPGGVQEILIFSVHGAKLLNDDEGKKRIGLGGASAAGKHSLGEVLQREVRG